MIVLIDMKFNEKQLLLETFFPKMRIDRGIRTNNFLLFHIYFSVIDNSLSGPLTLLPNFLLHDL